MTWGEFKEFVESEGVEDNDRLDWIDISSDMPPTSVEVIACKDGTIFNVS